MTSSEAYVRKISAEEAREGYIMVLKDRLPFFPPAGTRFALVDGDRTVQAAVEARACVCRGPELPHEHYFIRRAGLAKGALAEIERTGESPPAYRLRVR